MYQHMHKQIPRRKVETVKSTKNVEDIAKNFPNWMKTMNVHMQA